MSMSARARRSAPPILLALALTGAVWGLQGWLAGWIEGRLVSAVDADEGLRGSVAEVSVCLPCASYTLLSPRFSKRTRAGEDEEPERSWRPLLEAEEVVVSLLPGSLLRASPLGAVRLRAPVLHVHSGGVSDEGDAEDEGLGIPWGEVGRALLPVPIDRLDVEEGRLLLSNPHLDPPLRWEVERVALSGHHLTRRSAPAIIDARGRVAEAGRVEGRVRLPAREEGGEEGFTLDASLREIPATEFNAYLRHLVAIDLEGGTLDADASLRSEGPRSVEGRVVADLSDLDVVDLREVTEGRPLRMLWESITGVAIMASTSDGRPLEVEIEVRESLDDAQLDTGSLLALVVRRSLVTLVESPAGVLRWLGERVVSAGS